MRGVFYIARIPKMLKQDLKSDEDEHDAAHDGGRLFVARAKGMADRHAGDGEDKGCDANKRYSGHDVNRERRNQMPTARASIEVAMARTRYSIRSIFSGILVVALVLVLG